MILEGIQWIVPRLIRIRVCQGDDGCNAYDSEGRMVLTVHVDVRIALAFLKVLTAIVKFLARIWP